MDRKKKEIQQEKEKAKQNKENKSGSFNTLDGQSII